MLSFFLRRLATFIPTFLGVTLVAFMFIRIIPGDPILLMAGERGMTDERYAELMARFGYDQPLLTQYFNYLTGIFRGDLGESFVTRKPVWDEFFTLFPATVELSLCAIFLAVIIGVPSGIAAAIHRGKFWDQALMSTALTGYSMPIFWWALLLIIFFSGILGWTPGPYRWQ